MKLIIKSKRIKSIGAVTSHNCMHVDGVKMVSFDVSKRDKSVFLHVVSFQHSFTGAQCGTESLVSTHVKT